ncbi:hypothetical protein FHU38_004969 [Saccharomonospora amisosensis]|uniref:DUF3558 domain-containing protein n=1 Tax=Saccharomonospora amisosensis TaxID=1128677 RepID=A0A7X5UUS1_9PSEU|nr:DUF3558 family protein [Saccharomonospora amisosensis]NIJ14568.1 hypothetical protein [Saccharomonospora amisosensis]
MGTVLGTVLLLASCTSTVTGSAGTVAAPPPSTSGVESGEPCALLSPAEAEYLGLAKEGEFTPGEPSQLSPPSCTWMPVDPDVDSLTIGLATDLPLVDYVDGVQPEETVEMGGLNWSRYLDPVGGESVCLLATELSETSFVTVVSSDFTTAEQACEVAKAAAPYVAARLPGGDPAPEATRPPSPLVDLDPCTLLTPEQTERLGLKPNGEPSDGGDEESVDCSWDPAVDPGASSLIITLYPSQGTLDSTDEPAEIIEASGWKWRLYPQPSGIKTACVAELDVTEHSSATIFGGHDERAKVCDTVMAAIPIVSAALPPA